MSIFSIISVTRNNLPGLKRTHDSLKAQTCHDYEWVVIDGASADGTPDYLRMTDALWVSEPDSGLYDAMNKGLGKAGGGYLIFMNAGDLFAAPDVLDKIKSAIEPARPAFIYGDALEERPGQPPALKPARAHDKIAEGMFTHHQAMIYRRDSIGALRFDTAYEIGADYKFTAQFLSKGSEVLRLDFPVCLFEAGGVSQRRARQGRGEQFCIRRELALCREIENMRVYAAQTALMFLRRRAPGLYWKLRQSCGNNASGRARDQTPSVRPENRA
jgi:putative colanic acid biosynthesis glycosyltransferase